MAMDLRISKTTAVLRMFHVAKSMNLANSLSDFGLRAGLNKTTLNKYSQATNDNVPSNRTLHSLAKYLGFATYERFLEWEREQSKRTIEIQVMMAIPGGAWPQTAPNNNDTLMVPVDGPGEYRGVRVHGRSFSRFADDGMIAVVNVSLNDPFKLENCLVLAEIDGKTAAYVYRRNPERLEPYSHDVGFPTIFPQGSWSIIGKIVGAYRAAPAYVA